MNIADFHRLKFLTFILHFFFNSVSLFSFCKVYVCKIHIDLRWFNKKKIDIAAIDPTMFKKILRIRCHLLNLTLYIDAFEGSFKTLKELIYSHAGSPYFVEKIGCKYSVKIFL